MSTHNVGFYDKISRIISELSSNIIKYAPYLLICQANQIRRVFIANLLLYPPQTVFVGGYTVFTLSVHLKVRPTVRLCVRNVLFPLYLEESLMEFHQILQTHSYVQGKYY